MARKGFVVFILVLGFISSFAQNKPGDAYKDGKGIFFKISGNGLKEPSYILGSMHTIPGDFVWRLPQFENIIGSVKQIACEKKTKEFYDGILSDLAFNNTDIDSTLLNIIVKKYTVGNNMQESFINDLPKEQQIKCKSTLSDIYGFRDPKEWHTAIVFWKMPARGRKMINKFYEDQNLHYINSSIDSYIYDSLATLHNLPVYELDEDNILGLKENMKQILSSLLNENMSRQQISEITYRFIDYYTTTLSYTAQHFKYYKDYDYKSLISTNEFPLITETLVYKDRNNKWMKKIPTLIQKESTFIVVGLGHLFDLKASTGLLHQLENKGYTIERVE